MKKTTTIYFLRFALVIPLALSFIKSSQSQTPLTADAGREITPVCLYETSTRDTTAVLGGDPAAYGGTPPYIYSWSFGSILNDDSIANPYVSASFSHLCSNGLPMPMVLTVIDAAGDTARDTTIVQTAVFHSALSAIAKIHDIAVGDSTFIEGNIQISGGFKPYSVVWRPTTGLRDTTAGGTWAMPDSTTIYYPTITDSIGCTITGRLEAHVVYVHPVSTEDQKEESHDVKLYPNPARENITLEFYGNRPGVFTLFNSAGSKVLQHRVQPGKQQINLSGLNTGIYLYRLESQSGQARTGKLRLE